MELAVIHKGQIFRIDDESDLTEYDLTKSMAQAEIARLIQDAMRDAVRELGE